jgi:CubicO group peptidase (beta-lactamase class C family)
MIYGLLLLLLPVGAQPYQWPSKNWPTARPQSMGVESREFEQFLSYTFPEALDWSSREGVRTQSLLVIKDGVLIYEKYRHGFGPEKRHHTWSVSKLLANAFLGIAERQNILTRQSRVVDFIGASDHPNLQKMTIRDLLYWSSGFRWSESYEGNPLRSSVLEMLYGQQVKDVGDFVARTSLSHLPGEKESYSSGDTNLLSLTLRKALKNDERYWNFPWKELFDPLGISSAVIERDESGTFLLSSYAHMTPRDLAKIGLLYLNDGVWNKKKILPAGWVYDSTQLSPAFRGRSNGSHSEKPVRGMHLWTNKENLRLNLKRPFPDVPSDMFAALGHWGQSMVMIPSERVIVVRMADDRDDSFDMNRFLKLLLQSFSSSHLGASRK